MKTKLSLLLTSLFFIITVIQAIPLNNNRTEIEKEVEVEEKHDKRSNQLPILIPSRIEAAKVIPPYDLSLEDKAGLMNNNGPLPKNTPTKEGFALESPKNISLDIPLAASNMKTSEVADSVYLLSKDQVNNAYLYAGLSANAYCRRVVLLGLWFCPNCGSVPDAKIEKTFFSLLYDTNGYIITSASQKAIFLVFRGKYIIIKKTINIY